MATKAIIAAVFLFALVLADAIFPANDNVLAAQAPSTANRQPPTANGCVTCHTSTDEPSMHPTGTVTLGCTDCHGGNADVRAPQGASLGDARYQRAKREAHPTPKLRASAVSAANPVRAYTEWLRESPEYIQFINPGDLRVADRTCGQCHANEVQNVRKSMMTHGAMLWGAALYNNGAYPYKDPRFGESYGRDGTPQRLVTFPPPTPEETRAKGILPFLDPLTRWEVTQPGNVLRVFERGSRRRGEIGNPAREDEPGRPEVKLSDRGFGTQLRVDPVFLGLQKTRLLDPLLSFPGTNDQPGDYRSSGCSACHVVYANDRSPVHSADYARFGHASFAAPEPDPPGPRQFVLNVDPTIPKYERGHPITHRFTTAIPTSQCIVCHIHPGTNVLNTYLGFMWWDNESDGELMYPREQKNPTSEELAQAAMSNPDETAARGNWSDPNFLERVPELNQIARHNQFAD